MARKPLSFGGVAIEDVCELCNGTGDDGKVRILGIFGPHCDKCHGLGVLPNNNGRALARFVADHVTCTEGSLRTVKYK